MADISIQSSKFRRKVTISASNTVVAGNLLNHDGTNYALADASAQGTYASLVALQGGVAGDVIEAAPYAVISDLDAPYTQDSTQYLSATAGAITQTAPTGASDLMQQVGYAHSTELIEVNLQPPKEVTVQLPVGAFLATSQYLVTDTGPAAGIELQAPSDSVQYVWHTPRNSVGIVRVIFGWSANETLDTADTYTVSASSAAAGEANDALTDSISAAAFTVAADAVAEANIVAGLNAAGFGTPGDWVHIDIDKAAEGTGGEDPVLYGVSLTYLAV